MLPEVGMTELVVIAIVALIVVGPKDLPVLLRRFGQFMAKLRGMAAEFRASFDEMARQSELDDLRKEVEAMRRGEFGAIAERAGVAEMQSTIHEIDASLAEVGVDLNSPSYQYSEQAALPEPEPAAVEAPKKARKPRAKATTISDVAPTPKPRAKKAAVAEAPTPKARAPRKPKSAGGQA